MMYLSISMLLAPVQILANLVFLWKAGRSSSFNFPLMIDILLFAALIVVWMDERFIYNKYDEHNHFMLSDYDYKGGEAFMMTVMWQIYVN